MEILTMERQNSRNIETMKPFIRLMAIGLLVMIVVVFLFNKFRYEEFPKLLYQDSLHNIVQDVNVDRSMSFVTFETKKCRINWAINFNYQDYSSLSDVITTGDLIIKKPFSDTIIVQHSNKEYFYVLGETIRK